MLACSQLPPHLFKRRNILKTRVIEFLKWPSIPKTTKISDKKPMSTFHFSVFIWLWCLWLMIPISLGYSKVTRPIPPLYSFLLFRSLSGRGYEPATSVWGKPANHYATLFTNNLSKPFNHTKNQVLLQPIF